MQSYILSQVENINEKYFKLHIDLYELWSDYMLFSWRWWICLALLVLPIVIWILFRNKKTTFSLLVSGLFMTVAFFLLDNIGMALELWAYPAKLVPIVPPYIPWDFPLLPVATMFFIQWSSKLKMFIKSIIFSISASLIAQPLAEYCGLYYPKHWKYYYSFPFFIYFYIISHFCLS